MTSEWMRVSDGEHRMRAGRRRGNPDGSFSVLEFRILGLLRDRELYGTEIVKSLSAHESFGQPPGNGVVYPLLKDLVKEGVLGSRRTGGPPRIYYYLTETGRERLHAIAGQWISLNQAVQLLLHDVSAPTGGPRQ